MERLAILLVHGRFIKTVQTFCGGDVVQLSWTVNCHYIYFVDLTMHKHNDKNCKTTWPYIS